MMEKKSGSLIGYGLRDLGTWDTNICRRMREGAWIFELWWRNLPGAGGTLNTKVFKPPPLTREPGGGYLRA
jgi:hypothetical protein